MKKIIKELIPRPIKRWLLDQYQKHERGQRERIVSHHPKVLLEEKHINKCQLVLNRKRMLEQIGKRSVVAELGVNRGEFSEILLQVMKPDVLHLIDIWGSDRYHEGLYHEVKDKFKEKIESKHVQIHRNLSTEATDEFPDNFFDMIYIDTDHSYNTTKEELLSYAAKIKQGGIIAGHDYSMGNWVASYRYGVIEAIHEFCVKFNWELIFLTAEPLEGKSFAIRMIQQGAAPDGNSATFHCRR